MTDLPDRRLLRLAADQAAVVSAAQALGCGLGRSGLSRRVGAGELVRVHRCVYRVAALRPGRGTAWWAAQLAVGGAVAGGGALWWHGLLDAPGTRPLLVVADRWTGDGPAGVRVVRSDRLLARAVPVRGLPVLRCDTALVAALAAGHPGAVGATDRALQDGRVDLASLARAVEDAGHSRGVSRARAVVAAAADGAASEAERLLGRALTAAGVTGFVRNHPVGRYRVDIAFPESRVAVEVDGWAWHHAGIRFQSDRVRQNALVLAGWTVLRVTWRDVTESPGRVVTEIAAAVGG